MEIIILESKAYWSLVQETIQEMEKRFGKEEPWIGQEEAMRILGISSTTTLQKFRDNDCIRYSKISPKIILYYKKSVYDFLNAKANFPAEANSSSHKTRRA
ncbi:MAG: DNA-binding protein [Bacteroidota bacterium]